MFPNYSMQVMQCMPWLSDCANRASPVGVIPGTLLSLAHLASIFCQPIPWRLQKYCAHFDAAAARCSVLWRVELSMAGGDVLTGGKGVIVVMQGVILSFVLRVRSIERLSGSENDSLSRGWSLDCVQALLY